MKSEQQKDYERVAKIIKNLEERVSNLEQNSKSESQPNILVTDEETVAAGDSVDSVQIHQVSAGAWGETDWGISSWSTNE